MSELTDQHLLQLWATDSDEAAFREFATRYAGFVFGSARRQVEDASLAEEITQDVFAAAARQAARVSAHTSVAAWLHRTTVLIALDRLRRRARRERKIEKYTAMHTSNPERDVWAEVLPRLDEALDKMRGPDRDVLMLHYAEGLSFPKVAARLGTTTDAARMRANRAVECLSVKLRRAGVSVPVAMLAAGLGSTFAQAAPATLVLAPAALAGAGKLSASTVVMHALQGMKMLYVPAAALTSLAMIGVILLQQKEIQAVEKRIAALTSLPVMEVDAAVDVPNVPTVATAPTVPAASTNPLDLRQLALDALIGTYSGKERVNMALARLDDNNLDGLLEVTLNGNLLPEARRALAREALAEYKKRSPERHAQVCLDLLGRVTSADFFRELSNAAQASVQFWMQKDPAAAADWVRATEKQWSEAHQRYSTWSDPSLMTRVVAGLLAREPERGYAMLEEMNPAAIRSVLGAAARSLPTGRMQEIAEWGSARPDVEKRRRIVRTALLISTQHGSSGSSPFALGGPILLKLPISDEDRAWLAARFAMDTLFHIEWNLAKQPAAEAAQWMEKHLPPILARRGKGALAHMYQPAVALAYLNQQLESEPDDELIAGYVESADLKLHREMMRSMEPRDGTHGETAFRLAMKVQDPARRLELLAMAWHDFHKDASAKAREVMQAAELTAEDRAALEARFDTELQKAP